MQKQKVSNFLQGALWLLAAAAVGAILGLNLLYLAEVARDAGEKVTISSALGISLPLLLAVLLLAAIFSQLEKKLEGVNQRKLFYILCAVYTVLGLYLIFNVESALRADPFLVHQAAGDFLSGSFTAFEKGGYLYRYPNQLGLTLFNCLLLPYSSNPHWNMVVNLLMVLAINAGAWRISQELFQSKLVSLLTLVCAFAFLPQLFFILFVYGLTPGLCCMIWAFYHTLRFARDRKSKNLLCMVLLCAGAVVLKSNCAIGILAIAIYLLLQMLKEKPSGKLTLALICVVLCLVVPNFLVRSFFEAVTDADLRQGTPEILWVAMGTDIENHDRGPGWYNGVNYALYNQAEYDREAAAKLGEAHLQQNLEKMLQLPWDTFTFFVKKTISQWCEPLHECLFVGPMEDFGQGFYAGPLDALYQEKLPSDVLMILCKLVTLTIFLGVFVCLLTPGRADGWQLFLLYFLGGLIFHTFWEGKSQYTYPYVFCLIPCAMAGFWELSQKMKLILTKWLAKKKAA